MAGERNDPYRKFRFRVELEGMEQAGFSEVSGFDASLDVIEYREGTDVITPRKIPGLAKYGNISLKWGATDSLELWEWIQDCIVEGNIERKTVTIIAIDEAGEDVATWQVNEAWPTKYTAPDFSATASEVAIELLELAHEGMLRTQ